MLLLEEDFRRKLSCGDYVPKLSVADAEPLSMGHALMQIHYHLSFKKGPIPNSIGIGPELIQTLLNSIADQPCLPKQAGVIPRIIVVAMPTHEGLATAGRVIVIDLHFESDDVVGAP